ncbi:MAG TPA: type II secretion system protein N [Gammaproteobacteria bacterium]|nr:type II secretion system protein N [Gammaproteobacteria bacterium]
MMRRGLRWLLPGIAAYLVFLGATFPAAYAVRWLKPALAGIQLSDISGSVWSGQAQELVFDSVSLGAVRWSFDWRAPWTGRIGYHLQLDDGSLQLHGRADIGSGRQIVVHDLAGRVPLTRIDRWLPLPPNSINGLLQIDLTDLSVSNGLLQSADGTVALSETELNWPQHALLGNYLMKVHTAQGIIGEIQDTGGPLILQAHAVLQSGRTYTVSGTLAARDAGSDAAHLLTYLGSPDQTGQYPFNFGGHL